MERFFVFGRSGDIDLGCECDTLEQALSHLAQVVAHPSPYDGSRLKIDQFTVVRGEKVNVTKVELPKVGKPPKPDPDVIERHAETWAAVDPRQRWRIAKAVRLVDDVSLTAVKGTYRVLGSRGIRYTVTLVPQYSCECPDWSEHGNHCKHFMAVVLYTLATSRATEQEAESLLRALAHRSRVLPELHS